MNTIESGTQEILRDKDVEARFSEIVETIGSVVEQGSDLERWLEQQPIAKEAGTMDQGHKFD
jgi:hypothetical protein